MTFASVKIRLNHQERAAMGPGKADLLEAIHATRSVAAAGRSLGLSYWKTRHLLDTMSACFRGPLVQTSRGGAQGGGSMLTPLGVEALARFREMERRANEAIAPLVAGFSALMAD